MSIYQLFIKDVNLFINLIILKVGETYTVHGDYVYHHYL